jgi:hypothetical protein
MPAELQMHHVVLNGQIELVTEEMRAVVARLWPEAAKAESRSIRHRSLAMSTS